MTGSYLPRQEAFFYDGECRTMTGSFFFDRKFFKEIKKALPGGSRDVNWKIQLVHGFIPTKYLLAYPGGRLCPTLAPPGVIGLTHML